MIKNIGVNHIGLIVPCADKAEQWYKEVAGFEKKAEFYTNGIKAVFVYSESAKTMLELIQHPSGSEIAAKADESGGFIDHIAFEVEDIKSEYAQAMKQEGVEVIEGIVHIKEFWDNGFDYFLLRAAGGEKIEYCRVCGKC